jgi:molybdenum cofactor guanylyltransferase
MQKMTGIILSGGKARRMGNINKAFVRINGERLIDRTVRIYKSLFTEVILVTNSPPDYLDLDLKVATDILPVKGPLGGIYTGLFFTSFRHAFVSACDMPFLNPDFIRYMIEQAGRYDVIVPEIPAGLEPLHAIYSKECIQPIKKLIDKDNLKIIDFYRPSKTLRIHIDVIKQFDPENRMFLNINSLKDVEKLAD